MKRAASEGTIGIAVAAEPWRDAKLAPGTSLGRWIIAEAVGSGGAAHVYRGRDQELDRDVAVKVLRWGAGSTAATRVLREARAMARLSHPNVVPVFGVHQYQDLVFITMALVDGGSLRQWLDAPRSTDEILAVFADAGRGLAAAHREGLVHRDFKPGNVLIGSDGRVQVADFGLVHEAPSAEETPTTTSQLGGRDLTQTGTVMGTLPYMAPEQHRGGRVDARVDQYAFCVSLWEALYGARPFAGETADELHRAKLRGALLLGQPREVRPAVHEAIVRGLSSDPDDRWPTMDALVDALAPRRRRLAPHVVALGGLVVAVAAVAVWPRSASRSPSAAIQASSLAGVEVEAQLQLATAEIARGRPDDSARILEDAHEDAITRQLDGVAARAAAQLARTLAVELDRQAEAEEWIRHAEAKAHLLDAAQRARLITDVAWVHERGGRFAEAEALLREALQLRESAGEDPIEIARSHDALGSILQRRGEYRSAVTEHRAALDVFGSAYEIDAAGAHHNLGNALSGLGRFEESEPHLLKALAIRGRLRSSDHFGLASLHNSVAVMYEHWGRFADALDHHAQGLALLEASVGPSHPDTALVHNNIGSVLYSIGELDGAEEHYAKALAIWEATFGPKHFDVAMVRYNRGSLFADRGDTRAAEAEYRQALAIWEELEGPDNYAVGAALEGLGNQLLAQERLDEAETAYRRALAIFTAVYGEQSEAVARILDDLGDLADARGQIDDAVAEYDRAVAVFDALDEASRYAAAAMFDSARLRWKHDRDRARAVELAQRALAATRVEDGPLQATFARDVRAWLAARRATIP